MTSAGGFLKTNNEQTYSVAVTYPVNFPDGSICAYVKELMGISTPHKYGLSRSLCLYSNDHGGPGEELVMASELSAPTVEDFLPAARRCACWRGSATPGRATSSCRTPASRTRC